MEQKPFVTGVCPAWEHLSVIMDVPLAHAVYIALLQVSTTVYEMRHKHSAQDWIYYLKMGGFFTKFRTTTL